MILEWHAVHHHLVMLCWSQYEQVKSRFWKPGDDRISHFRPHVHTLHTPDLNYPSVYPSVLWPHPPYTSTYPIDESLRNHRNHRNHHSMWQLQGVTRMGETRSYCGGAFFPSPIDVYFSIAWDMADNISIIRERSTRQDCPSSETSWCLAQKNRIVTDAEKRAVQKLDYTVVPVMTMFYLLSFLVSLFPRHCFVLDCWFVCT